MNQIGQGQQKGNTQKEEKMKLHNDLMERYMQSALKKYNSEQNLDEVCESLILHFPF
jgi:flagellar biosynthesis/type III secretory pathway protein FliH